ncbi:EAL domain-containing protein [Leptolyngbya sp. FACHB-16]|nr:EAL domain-containing protein [Leptolyngbya sp. FACHB-8]MBD2153964.1 EAL domain-containing protein [Leptolyngbya sp. FACHB-16]
MLLTQARENKASIAKTLQNVLRLIRSHLDMEIAFISEFRDGRRFFRYIDSKHEETPIQVGGSGPLDESYCQRVVDGRLPELITDALQCPAALELEVTIALPVGAHLSVPIRLGNGRLYGTFCCFSREPDPTLVERDLSLMRVFAEFVSQQIEQDLVANQARREVTERILSVLNTSSIGIVYQPIYCVSQDRFIGFESLTRFIADPPQAPNVWFDEAQQVGLSEQLEMLVISKVLQDMPQFPDDVYITLNVAPENILSGAITRSLVNAPLERIVLEVTEHAPIDDYETFERTLFPLRDQGTRLAVDDAGAGYASFRHILNLKPDIIKLDMSLTRGIHLDAARRALATALITFAGETESQIVAEGVETIAELEVLKKLRVNKVQGYLMGRPMPSSDATALVQTSS